MVAICYESPSRFARYTVNAGSAIPKGTILKLLTPNTADACSAGSDVCGGIAMYETSGSTITGSVTEISAALDGVWGLACVGSITIGGQVAIYGPNQIKAIETLDEEHGFALGKSLETANGSTTIKVRVNV